jgi:hypothetical protein
MKIDPGQDYEYSGRTILAENKVPVYQLHICQSANVWMDPRHLAVESVHHTGNIYCLSTTHGSFYMEQGGHAFWTGNSDGKTSLKRVSHVITDLWIEKGLVMGEAEILNTPEGKTLKALIEAQIPIGVSSRGFGSTKPAADEAEDVQDDFSLKTYDFVADPAVRTAIPNITMESVDEPTAAQMFLAEFPDVATQIQEAAAQDALARAKDKVVANLETAVQEAERRVRVEMTEAFEKRLGQALIEAREDLGSQIREEYAVDPAVGAARATLAAIAEMVGAYRQHPDEAAVRDALRAKDMEVAEREQERDEALEFGTKTAILLHVERRIGGHPMAEAIRELMREAHMESVADVDVKLAAILDHLPATPAGDISPNGPSEEEVQLREENATLHGETKLWQSKAEALDEKLKRVVELTKRADDRIAESDARAERADALLAEAEARAVQAELDAYKARKVVGLVNSSSVLGLLEDVTSQADVDKVVARHGSMEISDPDLREMRRKLQRGNGDTRELAEDRRPAGVPRGSDDFGNSFDIMRKLAGYNN